MNTLSFGLKLEGAPQAKAQLQEIAALQAKLNKGNILSGINPATVSRSPELLAELRRLTAAQAGPFPLGAFLNQSMGIGAGQNRPNRSNYQAFWRSLVPPQLVPPIIPQGVNFRQAALGVGVSAFSPWVGARLLSGAGLFGSGGGGNGLGRLLGGAGGLGGFATALIAITAVTEALKKAFEHLISAIQEGARLYQHAARLGLGVGKTAQLEFLGKAIGLSPNEIDTLALRGSHPRGGASRQAFFNQNDIKLLLGSGSGSAQLGNLQQVKNMAEYTTRAFMDSALASQSMENNAKAMQEIFYQGERVFMSIRVVFSDIATLLLPVIKKLAEDAFNLFTIIDKFYLQPYVALAKTLAGMNPLGSQSPGQSRLFAGRGSGIGAGGPWERMGFVIGGFAQQDYARKTAENTAEIAKNTKGFSEFTKGLSGKNQGANGFNANFNFFHALP